jgi:hypothetical protein
MPARAQRIRFPSGAVAGQDETVRRRHQDEMRAIAADPEKARAYIRRVSLLESVQRFGIGRPATDLELEEAR